MSVRGRKYVEDFICYLCIANLTDLCSSSGVLSIIKTFAIRETERRHVNVASLSFCYVQRIYVHRVRKYGVVI